MATVTFTIKRGDSFAVNITIKDSAGDPVNLTGQTVFFTAKKWVEDRDVDAVISEAVVDLVSPADGIVTISLTPAQTSLFSPGVYWWDVQVVNGDTVVSTTKQRLRVVADITNDITS